MCLLAVLTPQVRIYARPEFSHTERLDNIIVGADLKPVSNVFFQYLCAQKYDRNINLVADPLTELITVFTGHHDIEKREIVVIEIPDIYLIRGIKSGHPVSVRLQCPLNDRYDPGFIVNN